MPERSREISRCERKISCMAERSLAYPSKQGVVVPAFAIGSETQLTSRVAGESDAAGPSGSPAPAVRDWRRSGESAATALLMFCENMGHFRAKYNKNMLKTLNYSFECYAIHWNTVTISTSIVFPKWSFITCLYRTNGVCTHMTSGGDVSAQSIRRMTLPPIYGLASKYLVLTLTTVLTLTS